MFQTYGSTHNTATANQALLNKASSTDIKGASKDFYNLVMEMLSDYIEPEKDWTHRINVSAENKLGSAAVTIILNQTMNDWLNFTEFVTTLKSNMMAMEKQAGQALIGS